MAEIIILAFLVSSAAGMFTINVAKANPMLPTSPNKDPPKVTVNSVTQVGNGSGDASVSFKVTYPDSWSGYLYTRVDKVYYQIDNQPSITLYDYDALNSTGELKRETYFTIIIYNLTVEQHVLAINVLSESPYNPPPYPPNWLSPSHYYSTLTQNVTLTMDANYAIQWSVPTPTPMTTSSQGNQQSQSEITTPEPTAAAPPYAVLPFSPSLSSSPAPTALSTPSPTLPPSPSPLPSPTESPTQQPTPIPTQQPYPIGVLVGINPLPLIIGIIIVTIVAIVVVLVYFRKRRG